MFLVALATADRRFLECIFFLLQIFSFCVKNSARDWGPLRSIRIYNPLQFGWLLTVVARGWVDFSTDDDRNCKRRNFVRQVFSLFLQQCTFFSFISNIVIFFIGQLDVEIEGWCFFGLVGWLARGIPLEIVLWVFSYLLAFSNQSDENFMVCNF